MRRRSLYQMNEAELKQGRRKFIWRHGVLRFGLIVGVLATMSLRLDHRNSTGEAVFGRGLLHDLVVNITSASLAGVLYGLSMWTLGGGVSRKQG